MIGKWPNTYVVTKAVAEETVRKNGKDLPITVFRPGISESNILFLLLLIK